jgi:hypothetical protein
MTLSVSRLPTPDERRLELEALERELRREMRWVYARAILGCLLSMAVGLVSIAWAVHATDERYATIAFWGGMLVGNGGILVTLVVTYHRAMEEGWL